MEERYTLLVSRLFALVALSGGRKRLISESLFFFLPTRQLEEATTSLADEQHLVGVVGLYRQHITQLMEWVSSTHADWTCYSPEVLQLDVIATQSGTAGWKGPGWVCLPLQTVCQKNRERAERLEGGGN